MYTRYFRTLMAATAAGVAVTALGAVSALPAQAAAHKPAAPIVTKRFAGYNAGHGTGWRFRWATTNSTVLNCSSAAAQNGWTGNGVGIGVNSHKWAAEVGVTCSGAHGAFVAYVLTFNGHRLKPVLINLRPKGGDELTMSVFYDQKHGTLTFTGTNHATNNTQQRVVGVGRGISYFGAGAGSEFEGTLKPTTTLRTGHFTRTRFTSYNGRKGSTLGPWPTHRVILVTSTVSASPSALSNGGQNFSVFQFAAN
jgi:hypothetical protein